MVRIYLEVIKGCISPALKVKSWSLIHVLGVCHKGLQRDLRLYA